MCLYIHMYVYFLRHKLTLEAKPFPVGRAGCPESIRPCDTKKQAFAAGTFRDGPHRVFAHVCNLVPKLPFSSGHVTAGVIHPASHTQHSRPSWTNTVGWLVPHVVIFPAALGEKGRDTVLCQASPQGRLQEEGTVSHWPRMPGAQAERERCRLCIGMRTGSPALHSHRQGSRTPFQSDHRKSMTTRGQWRGGRGQQTALAQRAAAKWFTLEGGVTSRSPRRRHVFDRTVTFKSSFCTACSGREKGEEKMPLAGVMVI